MALKSEWVETALRITGRFETSDDPLAGVSGDFDGMGLSLGVLQWNIGTGSLQPIIKEVGRPAVVAMMPIYGGELWEASTNTIPHGLRIVRAWQTNSRLRPAVVAELKALLRSERCIQQQVAAAHGRARLAFATATDWSKRKPTLQEFCWFFDLVTQNGGLKGVTSEGVVNFIDAAGTEHADDVACDWLAARSSEESGFKDAHRNAALWRDAIAGEHMRLFIASYLRAQSARMQWRADVLNRKGTIASGVGWVHGEMHDLRSLWND